MLRISLKFPLRNIFCLKKQEHDFQLGAPFVYEGNRIHKINTHNGAPLDIPFNEENPVFGHEDPLHFFSEIDSCDPTDGLLDIENMEIVSIEMRILYCFSKRLSPH